MDLLPTLVLYSRSEKGAGGRGRGAYGPPRPGVLLNIKTEKVKDEKYWERRRLVSFTAMYTIY